MSLTARRLFGAATLLALTTMTTGLLATAALASPEEKATPVPGDDRAVYHDGNVDIGQPGNGCEVLGLPGEEMDAPADIFTKTDPYIDITANPTGYTITGVFVKGGQGGGGNIYYVDLPADVDVNPLGEMPWNDLHPPQNPSGEPAGISHWFICVEKDETSTTPSTTETTTPTTGTETETTTPTTSVTTSPEVSGTTTAPSTAVTTTTPAVAAGGSNDDLADTGFGSMWLLIVGLGLVGAGAAFVASPKLRGLIRR